MSLRKYGWSGAVTVFGAEPIPAYERPPLSKNALLAPEWRLVHPYSAAAYAEAGIDLRVGTRVDGIEPDRRHVRLATGETLRYDKLLLALGAGRARQGDGWTDGEPTRRPLPSALRASGSLSLIIDRIVA